VLCILHIMRTRCHAVVANILLACVATVLVAFLASPRSSHQDVQTPVLVRVLQGPHTDAQFYTTPAFSKQLEWFRRAHFGPADPHMSGVDDVQPMLLRNLALFPDTSNAGSPQRAGWRTEALAWIPVGLLLLAWLDRPGSSSTEAGGPGLQAAAQKAMPRRQTIGGMPVIALAEV